VSAHTEAAPGEREGVDYYFWSPDRFLKAWPRENSEHAEYAGELYGTSGPTSNEF